MLNSPTSTFSDFIQEKPKTSIEKDNFQFSHDILEKTIDFKESLFKIRRFLPHCKSKSMEKTLSGNFSSNYLKPVQNNTSFGQNFFENKHFPNKTNLLYLQNLKTTIFSQFPNLSKKQFNSPPIYKFQKEKDFLLQNFNKDKETLSKLLKTEKRRQTVIKEEEKEYFSGLENLHKRFQTVHLNPKEGISKDATKFVAYLDFQNSIKDKEYLIGKQKQQIEQQVAETYKEFHAKRGRRVLEWKLA